MAYWCVWRLNHRWAVIWRFGSHLYTPISTCAVSASSELVAYLCVYGSIFSSLRDKLKLGLSREDGRGLGVKARVTEPPSLFHC